MHFVYMVRCADGTLYTGYARDPREREKVHNSGRGAHYTACRRPVRLVYSEKCESQGEALKREYQLKRLTRLWVLPAPVDVAALPRAAACPSCLKRPAAPSRIRVTCS
jgi:putative endonuclease